ncbi:MAG: tRNA threonylcarbamoyladenosine dehydratase [Clostridia bacterium]|nr:tRNA threonylcarbamoyladenosine dehydratase [Clostridia bacterium]
MSKFLRTEALLGESAMKKLKSSRVIVFGVGGVGGYVVEALARSGVGNIDLVDPDTVAESNINRQIIALESTVGRAKTDVMRERIREINPDASVQTFNIFYTPENADSIDLSCYDYIVDAIDTVPAKIELITRARALSIPIITSMGFGNKLDPTMVEVADISKTSVCPLARAMRRLLRDKGILHVKAVYSKETPTTPACPLDSSGKPTVASVAFVPSVAGLVIASEVIKDLIKE